MERTEIDIMINGSTGNQSPECSPLGEDTKTPDGAVTVPNEHDADNGYHRHHVLAIVNLTFQSGELIKR
jgi:hypothetical protein